MLGLWPAECPLPLPGPNNDTVQEWQGGILAVNGFA
jgi:hypothetical protein